MNLRKETLEALERVDSEVVAYNFRHYNILSFHSGIGDIDFSLLDFEYDNGYGSKEIYAYILFADGSWLERSEYNGSEWYTHIVPMTVESVLAY